MKQTVRFILAQLFLLVFLGTNLFAVELWNGFTTDMSPEQVEKRCDMMLQPGYMIGEYTEFQGSFIDRPMPYSGDLEHKNNAIPDCAGHIPYKTYQEQYNGNLFFYFRKGKLYAIKIPWRLGGQEIIQKAKETFGNKFSLDICKNEDFLFFKGRDENVYHWVLDEREIYFSFYKDSSTSTTQFIIDRQTIRQYPAEQAEEKARQQAEEKARQQRIRDDTIF